MMRPGRGRSNHGARLLDGSSPPASTASARPVPPPGAPAGGKSWTTTASMRSPGDSPLESPGAPSFDSLALGAPASSAPGARWPPLRRRMRARRSSGVIARPRSRAVSGSATTTANAAASQAKQPAMIPASTRSYSSPTPRTVAPAAKSAMGPVSTDRAGHRTRRRNPSHVAPSPSTRAATAVVRVG